MYAYDHRAATLHQAAAVNWDKAKTKRWMQQNVHEHVDRKTDEVNTTSLAEEAASEFNIYEDKRDYKIPDEVYDLAVDVGEAWEKKNKKASMYSYDHREARFTGSPEKLFQQMKESVESLLETRVKVRRVHEALSEIASDASGLVFKNTYDDKTVRRVAKELYDLDFAIGQAFHSVEGLEKDLRKKAF